VKILLTQSYLIARDPPEKRIMRPFPPLGVMSLAASLRADGFDVSVIDNTFEPNLNHFEKWISDNKPILVGISSVEISRKTSIEMTRIASDSGSFVILGGSDPVHMRDELFKAGADWICDGEGETTIVELARTLAKAQNNEVKNVKGLYLRRNGSEIYTGKRDLINNLDSIPMPAWDIIPIERYIKAWSGEHGESALHVMSSRGCPRSCKWCSRSVFGKTLRRRSAKIFVEEIEFLKRTYSPDYFWFADDSFTSSESWLHDFENELSIRDLRIQYECLGRVDEVNDEIAKILNRTGARLIWLGAESGSQRVLDSMSKGFRIEDIYRIREIMRSSNIKVGFFIMLGYPPENLDDIYLTVKLVRELKPDKIGVSIAYPICGTDFYNSVISESNKSKSWTSSGENRPIFKTKYSRIFYKFARRFILKEAQIALNGMNPSFTDSTKLNIYKAGTRIFSFGSGAK